MLPQPATIVARPRAAKTDFALRRTTLLNDRYAGNSWRLNKLCQYSIN
jgi:hypothetical protein